MDEEQESSRRSACCSRRSATRACALENIERATTRYAGLALRVAGGRAARRSGAPPLIDGALKVYVVNINDLTTGGPGIGDMLAGVLGGAGRFLGGFFGGLVGGTVSGVLFPYLFVQMRRDRRGHRADRQPDRLHGLARREDRRAEADEAGGPEPHGAARRRSPPRLRLVADVFRAAAGQGPAAARPASRGHGPRAHVPRPRRGPWRTSSTA